MAGLEYSVIESWEGWDEIGGSGDLCFYDVVPKPEIGLKIPEGTSNISMMFLMGESVIQFNYYNKDTDEFIGGQAFNIRVNILEEIPYDE